MKYLSLKSKVLTIVISIVFLTIFSSHISVSYFTNNYLQQHDTQMIEKQIGLVEQVVSQEIQSDINFAKSAKFSLNQIKSVMDTSDYYRIIKLYYDVLVGPNGPIEDTAEATTYKELINNADSFSVSNVIDENGKSLLAIVNPLKEQSGGNIFYVDLLKIKNLINNIDTDGFYIDLADENGKEIYSNLPKDAHTVSISRHFKIENRKWKISGYIDIDNINKNTSLLNKDITTSLFFVALFFVFTALMVLHWVLKPVNSLKNLVTELSDGTSDLTQRLKISSKDELGAIATSINKFVSHLQSTIIDIANATHEIGDQVNDFKDQVSLNSDQLEHNIIQVNSVVTAINELSAVSETVKQNAHVAANKAQLADDESKTSKKLVDEAVCSISTLVKEVESTSSSIKEMSNDAEKIEQVLQVIKEIAEQTNLLALNAAIEAARAGNQGRGFAVVADEVRSLAIRTRGSTEDINLLLHNLKSANSRVVNQMDATQICCKDATQATEKIIESLDKMAKSGAEINAFVNDIAESTIQQSVAAEEISVNIDNIIRIMNNIETNNKNTLNSTHSLNNANLDLSKVVDKFKV